MIEHCLVDLQKSVFIDVFQISDENTDYQISYTTFRYEGSFDHEFQDYF